MVSADSHNVGPADVVYEPLPEMDGEELGRLRAIIGFPDPENGSIRSRVRSHPSPLDDGVIDLHDSHRPESYLAELLDEVDRKLEKLLDGGPVTVINDGISQALASVHCEIGDMRHQLEQLQASLDRVTRSLIGD